MSALAAFVLYQYGYKRLLHLENRSFHYLMFGLLMLAAVTGMVSAVLAVNWVLWQKEIKCPELLANPDIAYDTSYSFYMLLFSVYWGCDMAVHGIFVVKYWLASQKV
jgi:hypothetical protein